MVDSAVRQWAQKVYREKKDIHRIGYFGSWGDWGVGSDLEIIVIRDRADRPIERRALGWDASEIPVGVDLLIYPKEA
jgi:hypothetical protein